ncbi:beta-glucosidase [Natrialba hulunbeirensis JCM 10989]|uniref:Beta-glucosidase n=1 Tax=Natrialba hulunbeirensis JCM 10989 TaxID=1227493 RepID=M0A624_9EURY|nr:glycoside hydrolase family 3 C-terminal domain-containing protein [Natrialba hulunbeirensis]ELY93352.1 beta-glucosidase [Natrialba hulunbeirensis JCM 10989]
MGLDATTLLDDLTLTEKLRLVHGATDPDGRATGYVPGNGRVGIPPLKLVDGPLGVRAMGERATAFPASITLAAAWNPDLAREFGTALGRETAAHDQDVLLGPGVNIIRAPQGGRNFEYYSEDPHLSARIGVETIEGIQSTGVAATVKHYVANNQETNRYEVSADVSERALREIYLPAFRAAVEEADVDAVMTAYNRVNGVHMSDHERLLADVLKDEWGFDGLVVSDWWGTRSTIDAARAGLDLEMPGVELSEYLPGADTASSDDRNQDLDLDDIDDTLMPVPDVPAYFGEPLRDAIESGAVDEETLDEKVSRVLSVLESTGQFNTLETDDASEHGGTGTNADAPDGELDTPAHRRLARDIAIEGTVLLTNDDALPLADTDAVAVIGPNADTAKLGGGGSSEVSPFTETGPRSGIESRAADVTFERGVDPIAESSFFADSPDGVQTDAVSDTNGATANDSYTDTATATDTDTDNDTGPNIDAAVEAAADADCAVVVAQDDATEFTDRESIALPGRQNELIAAVAEAADQTIVVLRTSGPVELPWLDAVDAVLETWYPGQADGEALAAVLFGDAEPGGRLPVTFGRSVADYPTAEGSAFPGTDGVARYDEDVFVGYRYFDEHEIEPLFPFGHGLSYTEFEYEDVTVSEAEDEDGIDVTIDVRNVGGRTGKEVIQVYVGKPAAPVPTPERELADFAAVELDAGESETVTVSLARDDFAYYDADDGWTVATGPNTIFVGSSSRDIRATADVTIQ